MIVATPPRLQDTKMSQSNAIEWIPAALNRQKRLKFSWFGFTVVVVNVGVVVRLLGVLVGVVPGEKVVAGSGGIVVILPPSLNIGQSGSISGLKMQLPSGGLGWFSMSKNYNL